MDLIVVSLKPSLPPSPPEKQLKLEVKKQQEDCDDTDSVTVLSDGELEEDALLADTEPLSPDEEPQLSYCKIEDEEEVIPVPPSLTAVEAVTAASTVPNQQAEQLRVPRKRSRT